jgi:hypothetical protein
VYRVLGEGAERKRILICREVDTNLDGIKDLVRRYDDQGQVLEEDADANYDGKIDTWTYYFRGRIARVEVDLDGDDTPDETRYYVQGKLSRVQRDTNHDGRPDVWEIYSDGHLERIGVDLDHDGRVDRWSRDQAAEKSGDAGSSGANGEGADQPRR